MNFQNITKYVADKESLVIFIDQDRKWLDFEGSDYDQIMSSDVLEIQFMRAVDCLNEFRDNLPTEDRNVLDDSAFALVIVCVHDDRIEKSDNPFPLLTIHDIAKLICPVADIYPEFFVTEEFSNGDDWMKCPLSEIKYRNTEVPEIHGAPGGVQVIVDLNAIRRGE